jgi:putative DNA methylase
MNAVPIDHSETTAAKSALECGFPSIELSQVAEQESWRKEINRPIYHIHKWWATRLGSVFRAVTLGALSDPGVDIWKAFYSSHSLTGKIVLDPFMGSGTTLGEAAKLGAKAVGCDINPVSTFAVRQAFARVSEKCLRAEFARLDNQVAAEIRRYYQTPDPETGELIPVLYYFWVKIVTAPDGEAVPLFSRYVFAQDAYPRKKPRAQIVCPVCWRIFEGRFDATDLACAHCAHRFDPQRGPASGKYVTTKTGARYQIKMLLPKNGEPPAHRLYAVLAVRANGEKVYLAAGDEDRRIYSDAERRLQGERLPLPSLAVRHGHNTDQARGYNYHRWSDFFNRRQLLCLGLLLRAILEIEDVAVQEQMLCLFSSTLEFNNMFCSFKGEGTGAVRHMFSNHILKPERTPLENSIWGTERSSGTFSTLFESRLIRAKRYLDCPFEIGVQSDSGDRTSFKAVASAALEVREVDAWNELVTTDKAMMILNGDSSQLPIPDGSVDAVVTDPPYFDFVHYSELSDFFFAWLSPVLRDRYRWFGGADSSHPGEVQHKDHKAFAKQLTAVFAECSRVLKDDGVLAFSFHHSRTEGWMAIYEAVASAGLSVVAMHPVHGEIRGSSPKNAAKDPISIDAVLVCRKRSSVAEGPSRLFDPVEQTNAVVRELEAAGMSISPADRFVICAAKTLMIGSARSVTVSELQTRLESLSFRLRSEEHSSTPTRSSRPDATDLLSM